MIPKLPPPPATGPVEDKKPAEGKKDEDQLPAQKPDTGHNNNNNNPGGVGILDGGPPAAGDSTPPLPLDDGSSNQPGSEKKIPGGVLDEVPKDPLVKNLLDTGNIQVEKVLINDKTIFEVPYLQTFLYKNSKNKILFKIDKFFPFFAGIILKQETVLTAEIFKLDRKPKNHEEIYDAKNLYKKLDIENNEFSFSDFLEINKDFYFLLRIHQLSLINRILGGVEKGELLPSEQFSDIQRIRVVKDDQLYFLEKEIIDFKFVDEKQSATFSKKIFIEPKFKMKSEGHINDMAEEPFTSGHSIFDSSNKFPYIKFRITSKKTNRKIDINLNSIFTDALNSSTEEAIKNKNKIKIVPVITISLPYKDIYWKNDPGVGEKEAELYGEIESFAESIEFITGGKPQVKDNKIVFSQINYKHKIEIENLFVKENFSHLQFTSIVIKTNFK